jgi:hypothetical protein
MMPVFDKVARKRKMRQLLDASEWQAIQGAMLFCTAVVRAKAMARYPETYADSLRWVEFRQYVIEEDNGELTHEARIVAVSENKDTLKRRSKTLFAGTGGTVEETVWDLIEQVSKEIEIRRAENTMPPPAGKPKKQDASLILEAGRAEWLSLPKGAFIAYQHGPGCGCSRCLMTMRRVPN